MVTLLPVPPEPVQVSIFQLEQDGHAQSDDATPPDWLNDIVHHYRTRGAETVSPLSSAESSQAIITTTPTIPSMPAIAPASFVEARLAAMRRREQLVSDHRAAHGVWPTEITMFALDIIALPVQEWNTFRPDHGIIVAISCQTTKKEAGIAC